MGLWSLLIHLSNFVLPALVVGGLLALFAPFLSGKMPVARTIVAQAAINSLAGVVALVAGLVVFDNDGKMATYGALVLAIGSAQWWGLRR